ncbi:hypothetical protein [Aeromicrobium sp. UC242_57]|uniref:hypothetical protein n=1 Tax=Aeromicrobium sp. UC242_57 TaxID=3374624 RepID=UPI0037A40445
MANRIEVRWPPADAAVDVRRGPPPGDARLRPSVGVDPRSAVLLRLADRPRQRHLVGCRARAATQSQSGLLRLRDKWVFVDKARISQALEQRSRDISPLEALRAAVTGELEIDGRRTEVDTVGWLEDVRRRLAVQDRDIAPATQPEGLDGHLRDYQLQGLQWMTQSSTSGSAECSLTTWDSARPSC